MDLTEIDLLSLKLIFLLAVEAHQRKFDGRFGVRKRKEVQR